MWIRVKVSLEIKTKVVEDYLEGIFSIPYWMKMTLDNLCLVVGTVEITPSRELSFVIWKTLLNNI